LGFLHNDEIFVCGRLKDLLIIRGRNHYPQDLESSAENLSNDFFRPGCCAAFTIDQLADGVEQVVLVIECRNAQSGGLRGEEVSERSERAL